MLGTGRNVNDVRGFWHLQALILSQGWLSKNLTFPDSFPAACPILAYPVWIFQLSAPGNEKPHH